MKTLKTTAATSTLAMAALISSLSAQQEGVPTTPEQRYVPQSLNSSNDVPSQAPATPFEIPQLITPIHTAPDDMGLAYGTWASAFPYKASFHDGMTFVPYLGSEYPRVQSLSWETQSITVGGTELVTQKPVHSHTDVRYEYNLGKVVEAYDVQHEGLEQTFVINSRPTTAGDLIVRGKLTTDLIATAFVNQHEEILFYDEQGQAIISYGAATAIDAEGRERTMTTSYENGTVTLKLDADWLATAQFPLVVDPLLGNVVIRTGPISQASDVDVLRDDDGFVDNVWFIYSRAVAAGDDDLWIWRVGDDLTPAPATNNAFADITTSWSTDGGKVALNSANDVVVGVFDRFFGNLATTSNRIRWHMHPIGDNTLLTNVGFHTPPSGNNDWRADIGGTRAFTSGDDMAIIWQREDNGSGNNFTNTASSDVMAAILDTSTGTNGSLGTPFVIRATSSDYERPSINQSARGSTSGYGWCAAWMLYGGGPDWDICLSRVKNDGTHTGFNVCIEPSSVNHKLGPTIEGQDGRYLVVYSTVPTATVNFKTSLITGDRIRSARVDYDSTSDTMTIVGTNDLFGNTDRRWTPGGCGFDTDTDSHWAITYYSSVTDNYYVSLCGFNGEILRQSTLYSGTSTDNPFVGGVSFDDDNDRFVCGFPVRGGNQPVMGDLLTYPAATPSSMTGTSCSTASLTWTGPGNTNQDQQLGNEFTGLRVTGAPAGAIHFMALSPGQINVPLVGPAIGRGCRTLVDPNAAGFQIFDFRVGSSASWDIKLPESLAGITVYFQDFHTNSAGTLFLSTRRLVVDLVK